MPSISEHLFARFLCHIIYRNNGNINYKRSYTHIVYACICHIVWFCLWIHGTFGIQVQANFPWNIHAELLKTRQSLARCYARLSLIHSCSMLLACILYLHCIFLLLLFSANSSLDCFFFASSCYALHWWSLFFFIQWILFAPWFCVSAWCLLFLPRVHAHFIFFLHLFIDFSPHCKKDTAKIWYEKRHLERILCNKLN